MSPTPAKTVSELRSLSDDELIKQHDYLALRTGVGIDYYLSELERRQVDRRSALLVRLTWIITVLTVVNVLAVAISLIR
jgi:hypothetical protein